jgi:hypothetical protein
MALRILLVIGGAGLGALTLALIAIPGSPDASPWAGPALWVTVVAGFAILLVQAAIGPRDPH